MSKKAIDYVTIDIEYDRPYYDFPELNSESGNPYVYWKEATSALRAQGFKKEALQLDRNFLKVPYEEQFNYLARFLDISPKEENYKEDDEFVYIKIAKNKLNSNLNTKQPLLFNIRNFETIQSLYEDGEDFSQTNCYGRNIFHYIEDPTTLKYLLEKNREDNFIDLFELDRFNSTVLQDHSPVIFIMLLNEMHTLNPELTKHYLHGTNCFNENALGTYLLSLDTRFTTNKSEEQYIKDWKDLSQELKILRLVSPEIVESIISQIPNLPIVKENEKLKDTLLYLLLDHSLKEKHKNKKVKI